MLLKVPSLVVFNCQSSKVKNIFICEFNKYKLSFHWYFTNRSIFYSLGASFKKFLKSHLVSLLSINQLQLDVFTETCFHQVIIYLFGGMKHFYYHSNIVSIFDMVVQDELFLYYDFLFGFIDSSYYRQIHNVPNDCKIIVLHRMYSENKI